MKGQKEGNFFSSDFPLPILCVCQLYKKTPAVISTMEAPPTPLADVGAILATLTEGQTEIGAHNKMGVSPVISDPTIASSFW